MPIIACPNCQGKLRFPEDTPPRRVKCPTCGHVFLSSAGGDPNAPVAAGSLGSREPRSDFDYDDLRSDDRRRAHADDRGRRRRDDEDRRRRADDDPDRRSRRDRSRVYDRRSRRSDDDYDDRRPRRADKRAVEGQFNRASLACLLIFIGGWLVVGALGVMVFHRLLWWADVREGLNIFLVVAGLLGLGHLLTSAVGYGFLVSGPRARGALGLAIATASVAAFHLILTTILATSESRAWGDQYMSVRWPNFVSESNDLGELLYYMIGPLRRVWSPGGRAVLSVFVNLAEVALAVCLLLTLRAIALQADDRRRARLAMQTVIANAAAAAALLVAGVLFGILFRAVETEKGGMSAVDNLYHLVVYLTQAGVAVWTTLVVKGVKDSIDYRPD